MRPLEGETVNPEVAGSSPVEPAISIQTNARSAKDRAFCLMSAADLVPRLIKVWWPRLPLPGAGRILRPSVGHSDRR